MILVKHLTDNPLTTSHPGVTMNLLLLVGSDRAGSFNVQLAEIALAHLPEGTTVTRFERLRELPFYTGALEQVLAGGEGGDALAPVRDLHDAVRSADAILIVTPEYNGGTPAQLKNAIDWASRPREGAPIADKRVAVIGASPSPGGTARARAQVVIHLQVAAASPIEDTVGVATAHEALADGTLDADTTEALRELLGRLVPATV